MREDRDLPQDNPCRYAPETDASHPVFALLKWGFPQHVDPDGNPRWAEVARTIGTTPQALYQVRKRGFMSATLALRILNAANRNKKRARIPVQRIYPLVEFHRPPGPRRRADAAA